MDKKEFGKRIENQRKKLGLSRKEAVENSGIAPSSWASYERGEKTPPLDVAEKIADTLHVSLDWLAAREQIKADNIVYWGSIIRLLGKIIYNVPGIAFDECGEGDVSEKSFVVRLPAADPNTTSAPVFPYDAGHLLHMLSLFLETDDLDPKLFLSFVESCAKEHDNDAILPT